VKDPTPPLPTPSAPVKDPTSSNFKDESLSDLLFGEDVCGVSDGEQEVQRVA
jgi:hypothetical protein